MGHGTKNVHSAMRKAELCVLYELDLLSAYICFVGGGGGRDTRWCNLSTSGRFSQALLTCFQSYLFNTELLKAYT